MNLWAWILVIIWLYPHPFAPNSIYTSCQTLHFISVLYYILSSSIKYLLNIYDKISTILPMFLRETRCSTECQYERNYSSSFLLFFNISDLLGIKMMSFLYSISSCPGILVPSSTPRGRSHCRDSVFRTLFTIYHSHMICQTILLSALTNGGFLR